MATSTSIANLWNKPEAKNIAREIAEIDGLYCGPAVVGWIAAVWNLNEGRNYDYMSRLKNKRLFADGPREFRGSGRATGRESLSALLRRETEGDLALSSNLYRRYGSIHDALEDHDRPIIICMGQDNPLKGLHYVALYKSIKKERTMAIDLMQFYWMDNGVYGRDNGGNPGLYSTAWREVGLSFFAWGAHRVVKG